MKDRAPTGVRLSASVAQQLVQVGKHSFGAERCGVLYGTVDGDGVAWTAGCAELENTAEDRLHNYSFDTVAQARVWDRVEAQGYQVFAVWHTHPDGPDTLSETDMAHAQPWLVYAVLWPDLNGGECNLGMWVVPAGKEPKAEPLEYGVVADAPYQAALRAARSAVEARRRAAQG